MATIVLSAVGAAIGGSFGGGVLGVSSAVIGRAVGATIGSVIDQSLLGAGSQAVETGRVDRFRLTGASEGSPVGRVYGRTRISGQVIWASRFQERSRTSGGSGKGGGGTPRITQYSYSVSLAIGLCEGEIGRLGRIWADGAEIAPDDLNLRVYPGSETQLPDPKIEAVEGAGQVPAYRGLAYVVIEDLDLSPFGNRVPQFSFEVVRADQGGEPGAVPDITRAVKAVALMPGTGEYALATTPAYFDDDLGAARVANVNSPSGKTDLVTSIDTLAGELPECGAASLIISWFGDDLRCGECTISPKVEQAESDARNMPWRVSGVRRAQAATVVQDEGRPVYGGTPSDQSVLEAIAELRDRVGAVMFYPFVLMEQRQGNDLTDPYTGLPGQPALPWRGRITTSVAPGREGTTDKTAAAAVEVAAFFGQASPSDFTVTGTRVGYAGPEEFSYRRFILHYAHLCALAGGVDAFCIGSEMRGLTQIRDDTGGFPAVAAFRQLAADVRGILGPEVKIGYAADWSEYFGYHPQDGSGDVLFHLDPLWADPEIDFVGIDNYMPASDWRDGFDHADAPWGAIHDIGYLRSNIAGGEGFDWYYHAPEARDVQRRTPITDGAHGEPWVFRYKDLKSWWSQPHHDRPGGVRSDTPSAWVPQSKPIWFTEIGCAAIDKGTNQPNRFLDPKSSESGLPIYSSGRRDDLIQTQYLRAVAAHWSDAAANPVSSVYGAPMVDMTRAFVWAWDARPYPFFPTNTELWSDGGNYARGHWLNGRASARTLDSVVREICADAGLGDVDTSRLFGIVRGYSLAEGGDARSALQPLMLAHGFDAVERDGTLGWRSRTGRMDGTVSARELVDSADLDGAIDAVRVPLAETSGRLRLNFIETDGDYELRAAEARASDETSATTSQSEMPLVLTQSEGRDIVERWLAEARIGRDRVKFALPPSRLDIGAGDTVLVEPTGATFRVDSVEQGSYQTCEAVRIEAAAYAGGAEVDAAPLPRQVIAAAPVLPVFLDLPLLTGDEVPHAPRLAVTATPWPGPVAVLAAAGANGFDLTATIERPAIVGVTETVLERAAPSDWDLGPPLRVRVRGGALASATDEAVLNGANVAAIGTAGGDDWEVFQFVQAELVGPDTYDLSRRLRGQAGTDALPGGGVWSPGSRLVLITQDVAQIELAPSLRGLARTYRIGPASRPLDDPSYVEEVRAFSGIGLRPLAPVHLTADRIADGGLRVRWIRRTRIDGDLWDGTDVPLGEASEAYRVRILAGAVVLREAIVPQPEWIYAADMQVADGAAGGVTVEVAQISDRFGPGLFRRIEANV